MKKRAALVAPLLLFLATCQSPRDAANLPCLSVTYTNPTFGLTFHLPSTWNGYSVLLQHWESHRYREDIDQEVVAARGRLIVLRDPRWTPDHPRQDIPILVFTRQQWRSWQEEGIYAGGVQSEICHNTRYVFAFYSRFNADDSVEGSEEAGQILGQNADIHPHLNR